MELPTTPAPTIGRPGGGPSTILDAVRDGVLDAELGGLLWLLVDGGAPVVVAGPGLSGSTGRKVRADLLAAVLDLLPSTRHRLDLAGSNEDFPWLSDAERLGWVRSTGADTLPAIPWQTTLVAGELGGDPSTDLAGDRVRLVVRALGSGFGLVATIDAAGLDEVLASLRRRPVFLTDDELSNLGIVLVIGSEGEGSSGAAGVRVVAAHYVRPLARDTHGHTQRLPPAVLATWDGGSGRFEHFAWGISAELAERVGRRTGDFEAESERRAGVLAALAMADDEPLDRTALHAVLDRQRAVGALDAGFRQH